MIKLDILNPKGTTKTIKQRLTVNNSTKEIKRNHKKCSINPESGKRVTKKEQNREDPFMKKGVNSSRRLNNPTGLYT